MSKSPQNAVHVSRDYGVSRVIVTDDDPREKNNVIVQEKIDGQWVERGTYNSLSDDYAYTNAGDAAHRIAKRRRP